MTAINPIFFLLKIEIIYKNTYVLSGDNCNLNPSVNFFLLLVLNFLFIDAKIARNL